MIKSLTFTLAALAVGASFALAADPAKPGRPKRDPADPANPGKPKPDPAEMFKKLDADSDGKISAEEWKASPQSKRDEAKGAEMFGKMDKDGDKNLTLEEFSARGNRKAQ